MAETQIVPLISWSVVTAVLFVVVGIAYRTYLRRKRGDDILGST